MKDQASDNTASLVPQEARRCRILHLEDSKADAEMVIERLHLDGFATEVERVETRGAFAHALTCIGPAYDLILADLALPDFDGMTALTIASTIVPDIPFIFVSGTLGEEQAIEAIRAGATDYVIKHRLKRLPVVVRRALDEVAERTERRAVEMALGRSEARYRTLFEAIDVGFCIVEVEFDAAQKAVDYRFTEINPAFEKQTGLRDAAGRWMRDLAPAHEQYWFDTYGQVARTGDPVKFEKDAAALGRWFDVNAFRVGDPGSYRVAILFNDITERKRTEELLRASTERLHELVGTLDLAPVMVSGLDGTVRFWSQGCEHLYGWSAQHAAGRLAHDLLRTEFPVPLSEIETALLRTGEWRGDLQHVCRDGSRLTATTRRVLCRDKAGEPMSVMESLADVTALRQAQEALQSLNADLERRVEARTVKLIAAEDALRQSQKMEAVGQLTGGIAHDFNNMLQGIGGSLEMMQLRVRQGRPAEVERFAGVARETVERAAALTRRLLAFSRRQSLQPKPVELDKLIEGLGELIRRTMGPASSVELRKSSPTCTVLCDSNQLENVLLNLAINARDAMPTGGRLTIETSEVQLREVDVAGEEGASPGTYIEVAVTDTGEGMDEATQARAFEPFFTTKPIGEGTGLGLSQVYGFIRQSGGIVRLDSVLDQGTTVRLYLPWQMPLWHVEAQPVQAVEQTSVDADKTLLLVEDEPAVRAVTAEHLRDLGYRVLEAADGPAAVRLLRSSMHLDLLLTDVGLPDGMNGRQIADAAREHRSRLPVLFITGYAGDAFNSDLAPEMQVMWKPFSLDALAVRVCGILGSRTGKDGLVEK